MIRTYYAGNHPPEATARLAGGGYGWHIETAVHVLRIITSGALDRYPRLQLVIGHLGETLPFMLPRLETMVSNEATKLPRPISAYLRENVYYTISGFNFVPTFLDTLLEVGADRIIFSTDYPFSPTEEAMAFLEHLPASPVEREKIAHGNAERLLRL